MKTGKISFLPLSAGLMLYPGLVLQVALDGDQSMYYGFPLPWNSSSLATSLAKNIYWLPLILDILFYAILGYIIWQYISRYISNWPPVVKRAALTSLWLYGLVSAWFMVTWSSIDPLHHFWFYENFKIISFSLGLSV